MRRCMRYGLWLVVMVGVGMSLCLRPCEAQDRRLALLVGNQFGWKQDPPLRYVIQGDLQPMARSLRALGFEVRVLANPDAQGVRQAFHQVTRTLRQKPGYHTFLFYYSGHADRRALHLGRKTHNPLRYKEFALFFRSLPVTRRIAIFDSCYSGELIRQFGSLSKYKRLLQKDRPKGVRARKPVDLKKLLVHKKGFEQGMRIISSSLDIAWELSRYKASVFTHHLLQGIKGKADLNKDGTISLDELFDFASREVQRDTGQRPQQLLLLKRQEPYALAPAYQSRLWIGASVKGQLHVSVSNFFWSWHKRKRRSMRLAIIPGDGVVRLKKGRQCWIQKLHIPKQKEVRLGQSWRSVRCVAKGQLRKGGIALPIRFHHKKPEEDWSLELQGGAFAAGLPGLVLLPGGVFSVRHRFFGLTLAGWGVTQSYTQADHTLLQFELLVEGGYRRSWGWFDIFAGGYLGAGVMVQDLQQQPRAGTLFRYGLKLIPAAWLTERWGLALQLELGFALGKFGTSVQNIPMGAASLGLRYRL